QCAPILAVSSHRGWRENGHRPAARGQAVGEPRADRLAAWPGEDRWLSTVDPVARRGPGNADLLRRLRRHDRLWAGLAGGGGLLQRRMLAGGESTRIGSGHAHRACITVWA